MKRSPELAAAVQQRMDDLNLSPSTFAKATGLTTQGLAPLRAGDVKRYQRRLTNEVCRVFGWTNDSIARLMAGDEVVVAGDPDLSWLDADELTDRVERLEQDLAATMRTLDDLHQQWTRHIAQVEAAGRQPDEQAHP